MSKTIQAAVPEWFLDLQPVHGYPHSVRCSLIPRQFRRPCGPIRFARLAVVAFGIGISGLNAADEAVTLEEDLADQNAASESEPASTPGSTPSPVTDPSPEPSETSTPAPTPLPQPDIPILDPIPSEAFVAPSIPVPTPAPDLQPGQTSASPRQSMPMPEIEPPTPPQIPLIEQEADAQFFPGSDDTDLTGELDSPPPPTTERPSAFDQIFLGARDWFGSGDPGSRDRVTLTLGPSIGYDSNVLFSNTDQIGSATAGMSATLAYDVGTPRFSMIGQTSLGVTYYDNRPGDSQNTNATLLLNAVYLPNRRYRVTFTTSNAYLSQPEPQIIGGSSRFSGDYYTTNTSIGVTYSLTPVWSIRTEYRFFGIYYEEESVNANQGLYQQTATLALEHLIRPSTTVFIEYRYNPVYYYESGLGSNGQIITLGFIHSFSPRSDWTFQAGVETRELTQPAFDGPSGYTGPFVETTYEYQFSDTTTLEINGRFGNEPSGVSGLTIRTTLRGSVALAHDITSRLTGDLGLIYTSSTFEQPGPVSEYEQRTLNMFLGLRFRYNPSLAVVGRMNYSSLESDFETQNYERTVTTLGLEVIF